MVKIQATITAHAPAEKIFKLLENPAHLPDLIPNLLEVTPGRPHGGFDWVYKMAGVRFIGTADVVELQRFHSRIYQTHGGVESVINWTFQPDADGTLIMLSAEYRTPPLLLHKQSEESIAEANQHDLEQALDRVKAHVEAHLEPAH
jgi:uncharacterized protein YndB with AHSA1/START domain